MEATDAPERRRVFLSGLSASVNIRDLEARLSGYGTIEGDIEINYKNLNTAGRFAYINIQISQDKWSKLRQLSGTTFKGAKLRIEEAKPSYKIKQVERDAKDPVVPKKRKCRLPEGVEKGYVSKKVVRGELVRDSELAKEKDPKSKSVKKGWSRGRYGRAIAILKGSDVKCPTDSLVKLWGSAHPVADALTGHFDAEEGEWLDRRGRIVKEVEIKGRNGRNVEVVDGNRVEVWSNDARPDVGVNDVKRNVQSEAPMSQSVSKDEIEKQLVQEKSLALSVLDSMFGFEDKVAKPIPSKPTKKVQTLKIIERFDPDAPELKDVSAHEMQHPLTSKSRSISDLELRIVRVNDDDGNDKSTQNIEELNEEEIMSEAIQDLGSNDFVVKQTKSSDVSYPDTEVIKLSELTSIFTPAALQTTFSLFGESHSDVEATREASTEPHLSELAAPAPSDTVRSTNYTPVTNSRGYVNSVSSSVPIFPLLLSGDGLWANIQPFFHSTIDHDQVRKSWEANKVEITRDWKRKRKEGVKRMRKSQARGKF